MKQLALFSLLLATLLIGSACQEEEKEIRPQIDSEFTYDGNVRPISQALLSGGTKNEDGLYNWKIYLVDDGFQTEGGSFAGEGDYLLLDVNTRHPDGLVSGYYSITNSPRDFSLNPTSSLYQDFNVLELTGSVTNIQSGTLILTVDGDHVEAELDFVLPGAPFTSGLDLKGTYQGRWTNF